MQRYVHCLIHQNISTQSLKMKTLPYFVQSIVCWYYHNTRNNKLRTLRLDLRNLKIVVHTKLARCSRVYWELPECCNDMILINVCTKFGQKFHWDTELFLLSTTRKYHEHPLSNVHNYSYSAISSLRPSHVYMRYMRQWIGHHCFK